PTALRASGPIAGRGPLPRFAGEERGRRLLLLLFGLLQLGEDVLELLQGLASAVLEAGGDHGIAVLDGVVDRDDPVVGPAADLLEGEGLDDGLAFEHAFHAEGLDDLLGCNDLADLAEEDVDIAVQ